MVTSLGLPIVQNATPTDGLSINDVNILICFPIRKGALCVQMDFTWTFEANAKCNNLNHKSFLSNFSIFEVT